MPTYTVSSLADDGGPNELRWAINQANSHSGSVITFSVSGTITLTSNLPSITADTSINGAPHKIVIDGASLYTVFHLSAPCTIENLTIQNSSDSTAGEAGSAIYISAPANINYCTFNHCLCYTGLTDAQGIIHCAEDTAYIKSCTFYNCQSPGGASTIFVNGGTCFVSNCTFSGNNAGGGGYTIWNLTGYLNISNSIVWNNTNGFGTIGGDTAYITFSCIEGGFSGTGNVNIDPLLNPIADNGGYTQTMSISALSPAYATGDSGSAPPNSQNNIAFPDTPNMGAWTANYVVLNLNDSGDDTLRICMTNANSNPGSSIFFAPGLSGSIMLTSTLPMINAGVTIDAGGSTVAIDGNNAHIILELNTTGIINISNLTLQNAQGNSFGGAVWTGAAGAFNFTNCSFLNNTISSEDIANGIGICNQTGDLTINNCTFFNNSTTAACTGGAIMCYSGSLHCNNSIFDSNSVGNDGVGAAIFIQNNSAVVIKDCTFLNNSANYGAALFNNGDTATLTACTFVGNSAPEGGALHNNGSTTTLWACTFKGNTSTHGSSILGNGGTITATNCIIYDGTGDPVIYSEYSTTYNITYSDVEGGFSGTHNINANPLLGPIQNNGGITKTMVLGTGSPCLGTGVHAGAPTNSQNGAAFTNPPNMGAWSNSNFVNTQVAAVAIGLYANALVDPSGTHYSLNPTGHYTYSLGGFSIIDANAGDIASSITYNGEYGYRVSSFDVSGYLVSSKFIAANIVTGSSNTLPTGINTLPNTTSSTGVETTIGQFQVNMSNSYGGEYSLNPGGNYKTILADANIVDTNGGAIITVVTADCTNGSRINSYDTNGYLVSSIFKTSKQLASYILN